MGSKKLNQTIVLDDKENNFKSEVTVDYVQISIHCQTSETTTIGKRVRKPKAGYVDVPVIQLQLKTEEDVADAVTQYPFLQSIIDKAFEKIGANFDEDFENK